MSKKLLSEAQIRRFAKLASLQPIHERWGSKEDEYKRQDVGGVEKKAGDVGGHYKDYEMNEDAFEDEAEMGLDAAEGELDGAEMAGLDAEADLDTEGPAEDSMVAEDGLDADTAQRIAGDIINSLGDILGVDIEMDMGEEAPEELEIEDEVEMPAGEEEVSMDAEEEIMEALKGINYVPGKQEIVNEVAKRVARRLLKAKQADASLKEALGKSKSRKR